MQLPVFYLKFRKAHGRDPKPSEMTLGQRRFLRKCVLLNRGRALNNRTSGVDKYHEALKLLEDAASNPDAWHGILREMKEPHRSQFLRMTMEKTPGQVLEMVRNYFALPDTDVERWECLLRDSIGLESVK